MQSKHVFTLFGVLAAGLLLFLVFSQSASVPPAEAPQPPAQVAQSPPEVASVQPSFGPLRQTDENGGTWSMDLAGAGRSAEQAGPPILIKTDVYRGGREVSIGLVLEGQAGERYRPVVTKNRVRLPAPRLRIVNEAGQVIVDDSFRYG